MAIIFHDHPCKPIETDGALPARSFTYDCSCGRLMIVRNCSVKLPVAFGKEYFIEYEGKKYKNTSYITAVRSVTMSY